MSIPFTQRLRRDMLVREVRNLYPQTGPVFDRYAIPPVCWDCSLAEAAHRSGVSLEELLGALHAALAEPGRPPAAG